MLLTGARGMLGRALHPLLAARHETVAVDIEEFDITDPRATLREVAAARPEAVIHAAAMTQVDRCETEWEQAYRVNVLGARNVALGAQRAGAALLYLSTDFVFDGAKGSPYLESDPPRPLSVYGASKLAGETIVRALLPRHYVVRTSWLFGPAGPNFVETVLRLAGEGTPGAAPQAAPLRIVGDQVGSPTYTRDLAPALVRLLESGLYGTYHLSNSGACSWYDYACTILQLAGRAEVTVEWISSREWAAPAARPAYSVLHNFAWIESGFASLRPWEEALADYLRVRVQG